MTFITTEYHEKIQIPASDIIPKSRTFNCLKYTLLISLVILIVLAILSAIIAESYIKPNKKDALTIGIVALVGIVIFLFGMISIIKEHIPLVICFSFCMIIYLLIFMYARIFTSPGWIIVRTLVIVFLAIASFSFAILIREWRYLQMSKLNHTAMKEYSKQYQDSIYSVHYEVPDNIYDNTNNALYDRNSIGYLKGQNFVQNQPEVYINGLPNQSRNQYLNQNYRKHQPQVHFQNESFSPRLGQKQSPIMNRNDFYVGSNLNSAQIISESIQNDHYSSQQQRHQQVNLNIPRQQQQQQQFVRNLPPYVDITDDNSHHDNRFGGQAYYK